MSAQPEALRLAEFLEMHWCNVDMPEAKAAAELRRLHTENERLHQINQSHEMKLSVRGYEIQIADLEAQRDALLEALKLAVRQNEHDMLMTGEELRQCRAAIEAVEGEGA